MRHGTAVAIMILAIVLFPLGWGDISGADDKDPVVTDVTIRGYVGDISTEGNVPLNDVKVDLLDQSMNPISSCYTGSGDFNDGEFRFTFQDGVGKYLSFELEGYTVRTWPDGMGHVEDRENVFTFDLSNNTPDEEGIYNISSGISDGTFISMSITKAHVTGYVQTAEGKGIGGATVTITSSDGRIVSGVTDGSGFFDLECYYGTYTLEVSCKGFSGSETMTVSTTDPAPTIVLTPKSHAMFMGLDTPHTMELIGVLCVAVAFLLLVFIYRRAQSEDSEINFVNDLEDEEELDENIREP